MDCVSNNNLQYGSIEWCAKSILKRDYVHEVPSFVVRMLIELALCIIDTSLMWMKADQGHHEPSLCHLSPVNRRIWTLRCQFSPSPNLVWLIIWSIFPLILYTLSSLLCLSLVGIAFCMKFPCISTRRWHQIFCRWNGCTKTCSFFFCCCSRLLRKEVARRSSCIHLDWIPALLPLRNSEPHLLRNSQPIFSRYNK